MPPLYYFPSEDCCSSRKLRVQRGWRHEWCEPGSIAPREVVRGPFSKPLLVSSTPFVLLNEADSGRKLGHTRTGIPDPWAEYLARQSLGEENVAIVDNAYRKWGVSFCQGIPDPWRNRPYFIEASFDELQKHDNGSPSDCCKYPRNNGNISPQHITRDYPREHGSNSICGPTNCPREYNIPQQLNCKCTPKISPQQFTEQLQAHLKEKTTQTVYNVWPSDLQQSIPIQLPSNASSLKPPEESLRREIFKPCYCKRIEPRATRIQPASPPTRSERKKKRLCPISKCFRKPKKKQTSLNESPNKNITNQNVYPVAIPNSEPIGDGQNLLLMCWQNCKCNSTPCNLICTNVNLRDSGQVQVPLVCQCPHTTGNSTSHTANNPENLPLSACNSPMFLPCPFDETEKSNSPDPSDAKSQTKDEKLQAPGKHEPQNVGANKHPKKKKVNFSNKQSDTTDLQGTDDDIEMHSHVQDERNKGR